MENRMDEGRGHASNGHNRPQGRHGIMLAPRRRARLAPHRRIGRNRRRVLWLILGLALGGLAGVVYKMRTASKPLTVQSIQEARRRWEQSQPAHYVMEIQIRGAQHGYHRVEVRDGDVVNMTTQGAKVPVNDTSAQRWSVDGLFKMLQTELDNVPRGSELYGIDDPARIMLRVHFNKQYAYPNYFHRHVPGSIKDVEWIVRKFEPLEAAQ